MNFIEWLKVILLGIVEGITEWLPISSTGHLILTDAIWPLQQSDAFKEMFNVVIQLGAILAVVVLYWSKLWPFHRKRIPQRSWFAQQSTNGFVGGLQRFGDRYCCMDKIVMWLKIAVSCLPAMLIGLPLNDWLDKHFYNPTVVALMLLLYGAGFLFVERYNRSRKPRVNSRRCAGRMRCSSACSRCSRSSPARRAPVRPFSAASSSARRARSPRNIRSSSPCP